MVSAATPDEARDRIGWRSPDIVIADMNCRTGLASLLQEIGTVSPERPEIPVIVVGADVHCDSGHLHALTPRPVAMGKPCLPDALLRQACSLVGIEPPPG